METSLVLLKVSVVDVAGGPEVATEMLPVGWRSTVSYVHEPAEPLSIRLSVAEKPLNVVVAVPAALFACIVRLGIDRVTSVGTVQQISPAWPTAVSVPLKVSVVPAAPAT